MWLKYIAGKSFVTLNARKRSKSEDGKKKNGATMMAFEFAFATRRRK